MTKVVDINQELYLPILKSLDMYAKDDGTIHRNFLGNDKVVTVAKRTLVLPIPSVVSSLDNEKFVAFHPLSENVARGDSEIQNSLKGQVTLRVTISLMMVMNALIEIAARKELHEGLLSSELPIVALLPKADHKTIKNFSDAMNAVDITDVKLFNVYNRRNGTINDRNYNRVSVVTFPLMEEILNPSKSAIWGSSKIRKADIEDFKKLFTFVLPDWDKRDAYSSGSDSMEAPSFHALMSTYVKIMKQINRVMDNFKHVFEDLESKQIDACKDILSIKVDLGYEELLHNLNRYHNILPTLDGNVGNVDSRRTDTIEPTPKSYPPSKDNNMNPALSSYDPGDVPSTHQTQQTAVSAPPPQQNNQYANSGFRDVSNYNSQQYMSPTPVYHGNTQSGYLTGRPSGLPGQVGVDQYNRPVDQYGRVMVDQYGRPIQLPPVYHGNNGYGNNQGGYLTGGQTVPGVVNSSGVVGDAVSDWNNSLARDQSHGYQMYNGVQNPPPPPPLPGQVGVDQYNRPVDQYGRVMVDQYGRPIQLPPTHHNSGYGVSHYPDTAGFHHNNQHMFRIKG